jgi:heat-inducible transcriptional repressor
MRRSKKETREFEVLCGLIDLFLESGRPVGSQTLKENGFDHLSSATIRNYFAELERQGYLHQPHASGGRVPTVEAFRFYASENSDSQTVLPGCDKICQNLTKDFSDKGVHLFLQEAAQQLCELTGLATFLSSVRFDHDFILDIKLVTIDDRRLLCVLLTEFGQILTEVLSVNRKLSLFAQRRIEKDLQWRIKGGKKPSSLPYEEELVVKAI